MSTDYTKLCAGTKTPAKNLERSPVREPLLCLLANRNIQDSTFFCDRVLLTSWNHMDCNIHPRSEIADYFPAKTVSPISVILSFINFLDLSETSTYLDYLSNARYHQSRKLQWVRYFAYNLSKTLLRPSLFSGFCFSVS